MSIKGNMKILSCVLCVFLLNSIIGLGQPKTKVQLQEAISGNQDFQLVKKKALEIISSGLNAGDGYQEVWIRDFNTFIELALDTVPVNIIRENLLVFFRMQGIDGNIQDGFIPRNKVQTGSYNYYYSPLDTIHAGHKNTVETDQETSLIQAVYKYVQKTGDKEFLKEKFGNETVATRMANAIYFLLNHRYSQQYGLIWGATTADWGDVQPEHNWGVYLTSDTHYAIDIYDNAMFIIALDNLMVLVPELKKQFQPVREQFASSIRRHLWDEQNKKYIPHIYLNGSPFPANWDENQVYYHGGTAVAIEAGLLNKSEIRISLDKMIDNVKKSGAASIGLTLYPTYPEGSFKNRSMYPYGYQNGGDWTWFGGRMIQQLIKYGFHQEAYDQIQPMVKRVKDNNGFFEWYSVGNKPRGSGTFRGEAGVIYTAIMMFENLNKKDN